MAGGELAERKQECFHAWTSFVEKGDRAEPLVRPEILASWARSEAAETREIAAAPLADESETDSLWRDSPLQIAVERVGDELRRTAQDGDPVLAVTDAATRILWTYDGRVMRREAEAVNFVACARWDDRSMGTNALDPANRLDTPAMVFSAEHCAQVVHNWVCWAAPVVDPTSGRRLGVIDLSTTWDRYHPIGLATARVMARLLLNRRRSEVLALLAPHPEGALARAAARPALRRPGGRLLHPQGRGLAPALRPRRPALLAPLPTADAGDRRRRAGAAAPGPGRRGRRGVRRRPAARHQLSRAR